MQIAFFSLKMDDFLLAAALRADKDVLLLRKLKDSLLMRVFLSIRLCVS